MTTNQDMTEQRLCFLILALLVPLALNAEQVWAHRVPGLMEAMSGKLSRAVLFLQVMM
jgi:hypothetical protein